MSVPEEGSGRAARSTFTPAPRPSTEPRYAITVVAAQVGVHVQTVLRYEAFGVLEARSDGGTIRLYSDEDVDRARRVRRLVDDLGVNLAGAAAILHLRDQLIDLQRELHLLRERD